MFKKIQNVASSHCCSDQSGCYSELVIKKKKVKTSEKKKIKKHLRDFNPFISDVEETLLHTNLWTIIESANQYFSNQSSLRNSKGLLQMQLKLFPILEKKCSSPAHLFTINLWSDYT